MRRKAGLGSLEKKFKYHKIGEIQISEKKVKPSGGSPKKDQ